MELGNDSCPLSSSEADPLFVCTTPSRDTLQQQQQSTAAVTLLRFDHHWFPPSWEESSDAPENTTTTTTTSTSTNKRLPRRNLRRRIFLFLTEPESSITSALFFLFLVVAISLMNIVMVMQTMDAFQYTPTDCITCGGNVTYLFDNNDEDPMTLARSSALVSSSSCQCPPTPLPWTEAFLQWTIYFFSVEWILRILFFEPPMQQPVSSSVVEPSFHQQWLQFVVWTPSTVLDALAIFPYYIQRLEDTNGLMSLRLIRLFQVFQLVRLGTYNDTFKSFTTVLLQSLPFLKLLLGVLAFGAAFFGSIVYWLEKGNWTYYAPTESFQFVRVDHAGRETISPFHSIPAAFWWFFVTATTVGYGDVYPMTPAGKWVATLAMLTGVLVVAFPVSVFSQLWSNELRKAGFLELMKQDNNVDDETAEEEEEDLVKGNVRTVEEGSDRVENGNSNAFLDEPSLSYQKPTIQKDAPIAGEVLYPPISNIPSRRNRLKRDLEGPEARPAKMIMDGDDYFEIMAQIQSIHESQMRIRSIMRKYRNNAPNNHTLHNIHEP